MPLFSFVDQALNKEGLYSNNSHIKISHSNFLDSIYLDTAVSLKEAKKVLYLNILIHKEHEQH